MSSTHIKQIGLEILSMKDLFSEHEWLKLIRLHLVDQRSHITDFNGVNSELAYINANIMQGSDPRSHITGFLPPFL